MFFSSARDDVTTLGRALALAFLLLLLGCSESEPGRGDTATAPGTVDTSEWARLAAAATADSIARGKSLFQMCTGCHGIAEGEQSPAGPSLYRLAGRRVGSLDGYPYTAVLAAQEQYWTVEHFEAFITDPQAVYPGNGMAYAGLKGADDRQHLVAYIASTTPAR